MQIAAQHLGEVVEAMKRMESGGGASEKRRFARFTVVTRVGVFTPSTGRTYTALTRDLSMEGMGLMQAVPMERGEQIAVSLPRGKQGTLVAQCTVMHARELADGIWGIGALFVSTTPHGPKGVDQPADQTEAQRIASKMLD
jgi:hypothetical protein